MHDLTKCSGKFSGMRVSMTKQSGDFEKLIFTTITHNSNNNLQLRNKVWQILDELLKLSVITKTHNNKY